MSSPDERESGRVVQVFLFKNRHNGEKSCESCANQMDCVVPLIVSPFSSS